jgi:hypothetical protein
MPDEKTLAHLLNLTDDERDWLERRKSGDLTPRQHFRVNELQTRAWLLSQMAPGPDRDALEQECLALKAEMEAISAESTMNQLNSLGERHMQLHRRVTDAAQRHPKAPA